ncbi:hypothetical protein [Rhizobium sp. LCM 4573]|uniref:hypothetical protein n=1 Tax=Rhizobium sp. LCM 4573 TaxID=1848291 RepID=UPI0008DA17AE|nr:hypothetical protein [Rhizobium sp. LCM 4573]OHV83664.1 hypothetical protein LCM4573_06040 [Rhizobium sp. LCM 4573]
MSKIYDYTSRVDVVSTDPLVARLTFETDYSKSTVRVSFDPALEKLWVQANGFCAAFESFRHINTEALAIAIYLETRQKFAEGLGTNDISVENSGASLVVHFDNEDATWTEMPDEDLRAFALHVIKEFDTRYVPSLEEIERAVVAGLREMGEAA